MNSISLLGASGSVGDSVIKVLRRFPNHFRLHSFQVHKNLDKAKSIINEFHPETAVISAEDADRSVLGTKYADTKILYGNEFSSEIVSEKAVDTVVTAVVGAVGVMPTIAAIKAGKKLAIANKETLVTFGPYIKKLLRENPIQIIPVDSEHNALFQLLEHKSKSDIRALTLTASGGSFRDWPAERLETVTVEEALNHPTWKMGPKITVDSAGLVNKSLEVIEAHYLFDIPYDRIEIVIHPESIVHGIIELNDGSTQMLSSHPDMVFPAAHAMFYPAPVPSLLIERKPHSFRNLQFRDVDHQKYPAVKLAYAAGRIGGTAPAVFNAANEAAVELFLSKKAGFREITRLIEYALEKIPVSYPDGLQGYLEADSLARKLVMEKKGVRSA